MNNKTPKMPEEKICVIGMGEIGTAIYEDIAKTKKIIGVDVSEQRINELRQKGYNVSAEIPQSDLYITAVYTTDQVIDVLNKISPANKPLVSIESTIHPARIKEIKQIAAQKGFDMVVFPHRFNPNDAEHRVFNLKRILGADDEQSKKRALEFYTQFMPAELITSVSMQIAALSKILENTHRFVEIAVAQSYKESCDKLGVDFETLQKAANTKWNINVKEARDGIKGKCLPKDVEMLAEFFDNELLKQLIQLNKEYCRKHTKV